jgi:hypothetical protein
MFFLQNPNRDTHIKWTDKMSLLLAQMAVQIILLCCERLSVKGIYIFLTRATLSLYAALILVGKLHDAKDSASLVMKNDFFIKEKSFSFQQVTLRAD